MESARVQNTGGWHPEPEGESTRELPQFLDTLIENLAEKVHDCWAERRISEGWAYGPQRDDVKKTTPNLVPYGQLPEKEKAYDRTTATSTIKNLYAAGFRVVPDAAADGAESIETAAVENFLAEPGARRFEETDFFWRGKTGTFWRRHPALLVRMARLASDAGWPLLAYDMVSRTLAGTEADDPVLPTAEEAGLRYLAVLSLMEVGALERAAEELAKIGDVTWIGGDLQGLRGRLAKMRGLRAKTPEAAQNHFREAHEIYATAYRSTCKAFQRERSHAAGTTAYYLGINAATMSAWAGEPKEAARLAGDVLGLCNALAAGAKPDEIPWLEATRGEAHLLRKAPLEAAAAYRAAAGALHRQWRPLLSMRRQALETARRTGMPRGEVEKWFEMPVIRVCGFPGQPADAPSPGSIVFYFLHEPSQLASAVAMASACAEFHLCFDRSHAAFRAGLDAEHSSLLEKLEAASTRIIGRKDQFVMGEQTTPALARLLFRGAVLLRAQELDLAPSGLPSLPSCLSGEAAPCRALLCADAKGYSRLDNAMLKIFVRDFLGCLGGVVDRFRDRIITVKTAGDGLFVVFQDLADAVRFSLELRNAVAQADWKALGLPEDLGLRISLDAGPLLEFTDPVTGRTDVAGRLVNRAARIEPITPVNHVYASRTLAALALALGIEGVRFEYAGETPLPKGFGAYQLYHLTTA